jgi:hypothetical protein
MKIDPIRFHDDLLKPSMVPLYGLWATLQHSTS